MENEQMTLLTLEQLEAYDTALKENIFNTVEEMINPVIATEINSDLIGKDLSGATVYFDTTKGWNDIQWGSDVILKSSNGMELYYETPPFVALRDTAWNNIDIAYRYTNGTSSDWEKDFITLPIDFGTVASVSSSFNILIKKIVVGRNTNTNETAGNFKIKDPDGMYGYLNLSAHGNIEYKDYDISGGSDIIRLNFSTAETSRDNVIAFNFPKIETDEYGSTINETLATQEWVEANVKPGVLGDESANVQIDATGIQWNKNVYVGTEQYDSYPDSYVRIAANVPGNGAGPVDITFNLPIENEWEGGQSYTLATQEWTNSTLQDLIKRIKALEDVFSGYTFATNEEIKNIVNKGA